MPRNALHPSPAEDFWAKFAKVYWEKRPSVFNATTLAPSLEIDADSIFQFLVRYSDLCREKNSIDGIKFYVDGQPLFTDEALRVLPLKKDSSLQGYHHRMAARFADYCLVCDELLQVSDEKWGWLGAFIENLYHHVGIPNRFAEIGLYLGNYRKTPFGVHVDRCGVFSIPVAGRKRFRLWNAKFVDKNPDLKESHHYSAYKKHSTILEVGPGDISYWPSSYWHIAESSGSFSATWSIGVWVDRPYSEILVEALKPLLSQKLKSVAGTTSIAVQRIHRGDGFIQNLPDILNQSISMLADLSKSELQDTFLRFWLEFSSKRGFKNAPLPRSSAKLKRGDRVRGNPDNPILWAHLSDGTLCLAVNGLFIELPHSPRVARLLQALNSGEICKIKSDLELQQRLYNARGIERVR